jgi:hypothetical protein
MLCCPIACNAQELGSAKQLIFREVFASRAGDARTYILLGGGCLRTIQSGNPDAFVSTWLAAHPAALIKPISRQFWTNTKTKRTNEWVYIWVENGTMSLNVDMVRAGIYPGGVMADMVDQYSGLNELLKNPKLADAKAMIERARADAPQDRSERLVSEDEYRRLIRRVEVAENQARSDKVGIWSDAMKAERESEGYR